MRKLSKVLLLVLFPSSIFFFYWCHPHLQVIHKIARGANQSCCHGNGGCLALTNIAYGKLELGGRNGGYRTSSSYSVYYIKGSCVSYTCSSAINCASYSRILRQKANYNENKVKREEKFS